MKVTYRITQEIHMAKKPGCISYGIAAYSNFDENGSATVIACINDVTFDRQAIAKLVSLCNQLELSTAHLHDVVEDFLVK